MSRVSAEIGRDARKSPEELELEIDAARAELQVTLQALEQRLSPNELLNEALNQARRHGGEFAHNLGDSIKQNPVPTLLTSIGIAWLMAFSGARSDRPSPATDPRRGRERQGMTGSGEDARSTSAAVRSRAHHPAVTAQDATSSPRRPKRRARGTRREIQQRLAEQPLLLGVLGLATGALLGAALPATSEEDDESLRRLRNEALGRAKGGATGAATGGATGTPEPKEDRPSEAPGS
jgi:hypothetical protein